MLEQLLRLIAERGVTSYDELAERASVSRPLLGAMLDEMARLGYLREVGEGCVAACSGCSMAGCSVLGAARMWALSEMGARAIAHGAAEATQAG